MTAYSDQAPKLTPEQEWAKISRQLFGELNKYPGLDLAYRLPANLTSLSPAERDKAVVMAEQSANDRKGYLQAMEPLKRMVLSGRVRHTDAKVWKLTFALGKKEFRPKYGAVEAMVADLFDIPETEADAKAQEVIDSRSALPPVPVDRKEQPPWLPEFALAVGDNELAQKTFLLPLLNMGDEAASRAIEKIAEGRAKAKSGNSAERTVYKAQLQRRAERRSYVDDCLRSVRNIVRSQDNQS